MKKRVVYLLLNIWNKGHFHVSSLLHILFEIHKLLYNRYKINLKESFYKLTSSRNYLRIIMKKIKFKI